MAKVARKQASPRRPTRKNTSPEEELLSSLIDRYTPEIAAQTREALRRLRARIPGAIELVYDTYNALAIGFAPSERASEAIVSIAIYPKWINLFLLQARGLDDPDKMLKGNGSVARHIVLESPAMLADPRVEALLAQALMKAKMPIDPESPGKLVITSIAAKQRPRRPTA
jgi:hypothetical protein